MADIISRAEAKARGLDRYFSGRLCPKGHISERYTTNGRCVQCTLEDSAQAYSDDPQRVKKWRDLQDPLELRAKDAEKTRRAYWRNPEHFRALARDDHEKNRDRNNARHRQWMEANGDHVRAYDRERQARLLVEDIQYRLRLSLRTRLNMAIKRGYRAGSAVRDLGCSIPEFRSYIEAQFEPGMSWENWGEWELDHIKPLSSFDLTDRAQFLEACHYENYQPLWRADNLAKRDNLGRGHFGKTNQIPSK